MDAIRQIALHFEHFVLDHMLLIIWWYTCGLSFKEPISPVSGAVPPTSKLQVSLVAARVVKQAGSSKLLAKLNAPMPAEPVCTMTAPFGCSLSILIIVDKQRCTPGRTLYKNAEPQSKRHNRKLHKAHMSVAQPGT
jgi:hypothetical protein